MLHILYICYNIKKDVIFVPLSALTATNVLEKSDKIAKHGPPGSSPPFSSSSSSGDSDPRSDRVNKKAKKRAKGEETSAFFGNPQLQVLLQHLHPLAMPPEVALEKLILLLDPLVGLHRLVQAILQAHSLQNTATKVQMRRCASRSIPKPIFVGAGYHPSFI